MGTTRVWVVVGLLVAGSPAAMAQVGVGQVTGIVKDEEGAAVAGATVTATNVNTAAARRAVSSSGGLYALPGLLPGVYRVDVNLAGFRPTVRDGIQVETGETIRLDFDVAVGGVRESLTVTADAPLLRAATASLGEVVSQEKVTAGVVNLTTRSGTNTIHGTGFEFFRHEALNGRNAFAASNAIEPKFRRNQFGGVLGRPIKRDRLFSSWTTRGQRQASAAW
jgi:hypothetical protein